jgi:DNA-damage-inducible protein J
MTNVIVRARVDAAVREEAAAVLATMGLTVSDAIRLLLIKVAQEKKLPFDPLIHNASRLRALGDGQAGKVTRFANIEALLADLKADD